jgi:Uncharacterised ACR, YggU family COG1872
VLHNPNAASGRGAIAKLHIKRDTTANAAVIDALANAFGVRRSAVEIVRGERGRKKTVSIAGATRAALDRLLVQPRALLKPVSPPYYENSLLPHPRDLANTPFGFKGDCA